MLQRVCRELRSQCDVVSLRSTHHHLLSAKNVFDVSQRMY
jgi:hypothetical protein